MIGAGVGEAREAATDGTVAALPDQAAARLRAPELSREAPCSAGSGRGDGLASGPHKPDVGVLETRLE
jgi:hypothetical protein